MVSLEPGKNQRTPQPASKRAPFLSGAARQGVTHSHGKPAVDCRASKGTLLCSTEVSEAQGGPWSLPSRGQFPCVTSPNTPTPHSPRAPSALPLRHELRVGNAHHQASSSPSGPGTSAWATPGRQGPRQEENQEPCCQISPSALRDGQAGPSLQSPARSSHPHSPQGFHASFQRCP